MTGLEMKVVNKYMAGKKVQKITPFLWFDKEAQEAANFYVSAFKNSKILNQNPAFVGFEIWG